MPKKIIQDIYVPKKSIRMVKRTSANRGFYTENKKTPIQEDLHNNSTDKSIFKEDDNIRIKYLEGKGYITKDSLIFLWLICIISITVLLFFLSSTFATATLTITPKSQIINLNDTYNIVSDKNVSGLHYQTMTIKEDLSKNIETDGIESVERKATGKAVLYNNFSTGNQRLIINTRLETKEGLIYRIRQSVNIPGTRTIKGVKTPGSVEVEIVADMPGEKYNMKITDFKGDFTIPGLKGYPSYTSFYGRLSADVTGGFIGNVKKVPDAKLIISRTDLTNNLKDNLIKEIYSSKPEQYILFNDNYYTQCNDLPDDSTGSEYIISEECTINAITFDKNELALFITKNKIKDFADSDVDILWNDNNSVSLKGTTEKLWNESTLKAKFTGSTQVVWHYDSNEILNSIAGQNKSVISSVIEKNNNSLVEIQATIRPMWKDTFPENIKRIKIVDTIRDAAK